MRIVSVFAFLIYTFTVSNISFSQTKWFRGSLHVHSTYSDGQLSPDSLISSYKSKGYDFIVISDHNRLTDGENLSSNNFLLINGEEITFIEHINGIGLSKAINPSGLNLGQVITAVNSQKAIPIINHPIWKPTRLYYHDIINLHVKHMEIYNAYTDSVGHHDDLTMWDSLLTNGKEMFGVASDDAHFPSQIGHGWIEVRSTSLSRDSILNAIKNGDFYSSSGIFISDIIIDNTKISVSSSNGEKIKFIGKNSELLKSVDGNSATYDISGTEAYIRIEVSNHLGQHAWTQPLLGKFRIDTLVNSMDENVSGFDVKQNYPNPFNNGTTLEYSLPAESMVDVSIYDLLGEKIETVINGIEQKGVHAAIISSTKYASGLFFIKLQAKSLNDKASFTIVKKIICIK